jgi:hypothetical protein
MKSILLFEFSDLFAKSRLGDVQPVCRTSEIHLFGQNDYRMEMTHFDAGEHRSNPLELPRILTQARYLSYTSKGALDLKKVLRRKIKGAHSTQES